MGKNNQNKESFLPPLWILTLVVFGLLVWLAVELKEIVVLLVVGYCIAYIMNPAISWLEKRRIPRALGFFVVVLGFFFVVVGLGITALPTLAREYERLSGNFSDYVDVAHERAGPLLSKVERFLPGGLSFEQIGASPLELFKYVKGETVRRIASGVQATLLSGYSATMAVVNLIILPFLTFYFAVDLPRFHEWVLTLFPSERRRRFSQITGEIDDLIWAFVKGQFTVSCILSLLLSIGLWIVGVELWFILAIISGFGNMVPYLGSLVGIVLSSVMALVTFGDMSHLLQVWAVYLVVQGLEGNFITPRITGEKVGLSPIVVILALFAGGSLFGLLGLFLAVPVAAALKVLCREAHQWALYKPRANQF